MQEIAHRQRAFRRTRRGEAMLGYLKSILKRWREWRLRRTQENMAKLYRIATSPSFPPEMREEAEEKFIHLMKKEGRLKRSLKEGSGNSSLSDYFPVEYLAFAALALILLLAIWVSFR